MKAKNSAPLNGKNSESPFFNHVNFLLSHATPYNTFSINATYECHISISLLLYRINSNVTYAPRMIRATIPTIEPTTV